MGTVLFAGCGSTKTAEVEKVTDPTKAAWEQDKTPITLDWYINFNWFAGKWGEDLTSQYVTKKTGVNLNIQVPAGDASQKLNTMMASGKLPDIITLDWMKMELRSL